MDSAADRRVLCCWEEGREERGKGTSKGQQHHTQSKNGDCRAGT
ncbi:hypothetical protein LEMLEM_LOCUS14317 [Lemmus lemmus]